MIKVFTDRRIIVINALKFTIPALAVSSIVFLFLFKKAGIEKLLNNNKRKIIAILITFIIYLVGLSITDNFSTTKEYRDLFSGLLMGPTIGLVSFIAPTTNSKTKS